MSQLLEVFADALKAKFALPGSAWPEDQLKQPVAAFIEDVGSSHGFTMATRTEANLSELQVRPDMAVYCDGLICGHIELKQPGLGADAPRLKGKANKAQWAKLRALPNLIYTDGREWALYRGGDRVGTIVRLSDDPVDAGKLAIQNDDAARIESLLQDFLHWTPIVPHRPSELAKYLAPLTRFLRVEVEVALSTPGSDVGLLASEWRKYFFPDADDPQFADAYAQTVTYAMLLARLSGASSLNAADAAKVLDKGNGLLARALELLGQPGARDELRVGFELLQRSLEALDPAKFMKSKPELWLYFYEDFLAAYDPKLRNDYGAYYTPLEVVEFQVRLTTELLETRFNRKLGFADDGVVFLDPAVGTGTYLVAAIKNGLERVKARSGAGAVPERAVHMAENLYGFEVLVGPYAVAHLRLSQSLEGAVQSVAGFEGELPNRLNVYLADTLESPNATPPGGLTLTYKALTQEHEAARSVKNSGQILVCLGNPPYDRQTIEEEDLTTQRKGGWVRFGDRGQAKLNLKTGSVDEGQVKERPIFLDFVEPASVAGAGVHLKNLYNDYVYFWRWALWRMFERQSGGGMVSFITASSYLAGPGFTGMREVMRRTFDALWIIDLGGDNIGTRKTPNVFAIQTPVCIALGIRDAGPNPNKPAVVRYTKVEGHSREEKLEKLASIKQLSSLEWRECGSDWGSPLLPQGQGAFFDWPSIGDIFPWRHTGAQFKRSWPISEDEGVLKARWAQLVGAAPLEKKRLFSEAKDKTVAFKPKDQRVPLNKIQAGAPHPPISRYMFRSFDRQYCFYDDRFGTYIKPVLSETHSSEQIFLVTLFSDATARGPAVTVASTVPDLHYYCGRGGRDVMPLYRDAEATEPNVTAGLLQRLSADFGVEVGAADLAAYVYALLGSQSYASRFWNELETPGPRVPLTRDGAVFEKASALGRRLLWLHTYAEKFRGSGRGAEVPKGAATCIAPVAGTTGGYPEDFEYRAQECVIRVGNGLFGPVQPEVWEFEVSGLKVVQSWLAYRMRRRFGKKSSALDEVRPEKWRPKMTDEFLELLWIMEATIALEPDLKAALDEVVGGECYLAADLPHPTAEQRLAPGEANRGDLLSLLGDT